MPSHAARGNRPAPVQDVAALFTYAEPRSEVDPFDLSPHYHRADGSPTELSAASRFSAVRLASGFAVGGLRREVWAVPPWHGVTRRRVLPPLPGGDSSVDEFSDRFEEAVAADIGDAERIAVTMSGGMDSAALLATAARVCVRTKRELMAVPLDIPDDTGGQPVVQAKRLIEALGVRARLLVVEPDVGRWPEPSWCVDGPRFDAWPRYRRGIAETAVAGGAEVLLHGTGADELLTAPPHLAGPVARRCGSRAARVYRRQRGVTVVEHLAPVMVGRLRRRWSAEWYWAWTWPHLASTTPSPTLTATARQVAASWADSLAAAQVGWSLHHRATWAQSAAMHALFPRDLLTPAGAIPERFPFLSPGFARFAYHLPLSTRFRADLPTPYLCHKALVASLLPPHAVRLLPSQRLRSYGAYARYWQAMPSATPLAEELGVLRPGWLSQCRDAFDRAIALSVEAWIRGAIDAGAEPQTIDQAEELAP